MKAVVFNSYGPPEVLEIEDVPKPTPKNDEILIKIKAASVSAGDCEVRRFQIPVLFWLPIRLYMGVFKPRIRVLGQEFSGIVEAVGKSVTKFKEGDEVFAATEMNLGAHAEYISIPENGAIAMKPKNITYEEAAALPVGTLNTLFFFRKVDLSDNTKILINGAGGSIGTIAIQFAKINGAKVTAVDSEGKLEKLKAIGADRVIDYAKEDITNSNEVFDIIFEVSGKRKFSDFKTLLSPNGYYLSANPTLTQIIFSAWLSRRNGQKLITGVADNNSEDLDYIVKLVEAGKIKPVIDKIYPIEEIIKAHRFVETAQKIGSVIVVNQ